MTYSVFLINPFYLLVVRNVRHELIGNIYLLYRPLVLISSLIYTYCTASTTFIIPNWNHLIYFVAKMLPSCVLCSGWKTFKYICVKRLGSEGVDIAGNDRIHERFSIYYWLSCDKNLLVYTNCRTITWPI